MRKLRSKLKTHSWPRLILALVALAVFSLSTPAFSFDCGLDELAEAPTAHQPQQSHHHGAPATSSHHHSDSHDDHHDGDDGHNCCRNNPDVSTLTSPDIAVRSFSPVESLGISWTAIAVLPGTADLGPDAALLYRRDGPHRRNLASQFVPFPLLGRAPPISA